MTGLSAVVSWVKQFRSFPELKLTKTSAILKRLSHYVLYGEIDRSRNRSRSLSGNWCLSRSRGWSQNLRTELVWPQTENCVSMMDLWYELWIYDGPMIRIVDLWCEQVWSLVSCADQRRTHFRDPTTFLLKAFSDKSHSWLFISYIPHASLLTNRLCYSDMTSPF